MNRRKFLIGAGSLAAGSGALVGTGAFTSVSAQRDVTVEVEADGNALLALEPIDSPNGQAFATTSDGRLTLDFSSTTAGGEGLGTDSTYTFDDLFRVTNQGTQPVYVWATFSGAEGSALDPSGTDPDVYFYPNSDTGDVLRDSEDDVLYLGVGRSAPVGMFADTTGVALGELDLTVTIHAAATNPASGAVVSDDGSTISGPTSGLTSYYRLDDLSGSVATDAAGTADGNLVGGVAATGGQVDGAALLETGSDHVSVPDTPSLDLTEAFSLAGWLQTDDEQAAYARVLSREQSGRGNRQYNVGFTPDGRRARTIVDTTASTDVGVAGGPDLTDGAWHHVVATFDESDALRLYVDGSEVDSTGVSAPVVSRASDLVFGGVAHSPGTSLQYGGALDDVRVYDRALSATEVSDLHDATK